MAEETSKNNTGGEEEENEKKQQHKEPPVMEWIVAAIGLVLVVVAIGFMLYHAANQKSPAPNFSITVDSVTPGGDNYLVKFSVKNTGDETAAGLTIEGELRQGEQSVETRTTTLTYAPSNSVRKGGLFFSKNPNENELKLRAKGYEKP